MYRLCQKHKKLLCRISDIMCVHYGVVPFSLVSVRRCFSTVLKRGYGLAPCLSLSAVKGLVSNWWIQNYNRSCYIDLCTSELVYLFINFHFPSESVNYCHAYNNRPCLRAKCKHTTEWPLGPLIYSYNRYFKIVLSSLLFCTGTHTFYRCTTSTTGLIESLIKYGHKV